MTGWLDRLLHGNKAGSASQGKVRDRSDPSAVAERPGAPGVARPPVPVAAPSLPPPRTASLSREEEIRQLRVQIAEIAKRGLPNNPSPAPQRPTLPTTPPRPVPVRASTPAPSAAPAAWRRPGERMRIDGVEIEGGWIYLGRSLPEGESSPWVSARNAPCLINPDLKTAPPSGVLADLGYFPDYAQISPDQRGYFLRWLASDRSDPTAPVGYVRLYVFGLEHRVLVDAPSTAELEHIGSEVERLGRAYEQTSLRYELKRFKDAIDLKVLLGAPAALEAWRPSVDAPARQGFSLAMKVVLARRVVADQPLDFDLAISGYLSLPFGHDDQSWVVGRISEPLRTLAAPAFAKKYPNGFRLRDRKTSSLGGSYRSVNYNLRSPDLIKEAFGRLPDPEELNWKGMESLCAPLIARLEPYARYLAKSRHPDSLEGVLLLPHEARTMQQSVRLSSATDRLAGIAQPVGDIAVQDLASACIGSAEGWNLHKLRQVQDVLKGLGFGLEPDPGLGKVEVKAQKSYCVFALDGQEASPDPALTLATVLLSALSGAQGEAADGEGSYGRGTLAVARALDLAPKLLPRLEARRRGLGRVATSRHRLARAVEDLPAEDRARLAQVAIVVAAQLGSSSRAIMTALERLYEVLKLDHRTLYAELHQRSAEHLPVVEAATSGSAHAIPRPPVGPKSGPGEVDMERVRRIARETQTVAQTLAAIYEDEEEPVTSSQAPFARDIASSGLDARHDGLLALLTERDVWSEEAFELICRSAQLMPAAAAETLNDWAYERFGEPVLEDEGEWRVNRAIVDQGRTST